MKKIISHRLRGFDKCEYSYKAIVQACQTKFPYLEIDTRVSADGKIFVYHDASFKTDKKNIIKISTSLSKNIQSVNHICGNKLLLLEDFLIVFSKRKHKEQKLCIDIKDYGFEQLHFNLIKKYNLEKHIVWISWIPQTLIRLHEINPEIPKILSYINLQNLGLLGKLLEKMCIYKIPFTNFILFGKFYYKYNLKQKSIGYQHAYLAQTLPEDLIKILSQSKGGICIQKKILSKKVINYCKKNNLLLCIFSIKNLKEYNYYSKQPINIIFIDKSNLLPTFLKNTRN